MRNRSVSLGRRPLSGSAHIPSPRSGTLCGRLCSPVIPGLRNQESSGACHERSRRSRQRVLTLCILLRALRVPRDRLRTSPRLRSVRRHALRLGRTGGHLLITRSRVFETGVSPNRDTGGLLTLTGYGLLINLYVDESLYKRRQASLGVPTFATCRSGGGFIPPSEAGWTRKDMRHTCCRMP